MSDSLTVADRPTGQWSALAALAGALLLAMTTWFSAAAVLPQLRASWGLSDLAGSLLTIAVQLGFVTGPMPGWLQHVLGDVSVAGRGSSPMANS